MTTNMRLIDAHNFAASVYERIADMLSTKEDCQTAQDTPGYTDPRCSEPGSGGRHAGHR